MTPLNSEALVGWHYNAMYYMTEELIQQVTDSWLTDISVILVKDYLKRQYPSRIIKTLKLSVKMLLHKLHLAASDLALSENRFSMEPGSPADF